MELVKDKQELLTLKEVLMQIRALLLKKHAEMPVSSIEASNYLADAGSIARVIKTLRSA